MLSSCSDIIEFQEFGIGFVAALYSIHASSAIGWTQERKASQNINILKCKSILHLELATVYLRFFPQTYLVIARVPRATHKRWNHVHLEGSQTDVNWQESRQVHHRFLNDRIFNRLIPEFHFHKNNRYAMQWYRAFLQTFLSSLCRGGDFQRTESHRCTLRFSHLLLVFQIGLSAFILHDEFWHVDIISLWVFFFYCRWFVDLSLPSNVCRSFLMRWRISWTTSVLWLVGKDTPFQN